MRAARSEASKSRNDRLADEVSASSVLPVPWYSATCGYAHSEHVRTSTRSSDATPEAVLVPSCAPPTVREPSRVEAVGAVSAGAVVHARHHEQPHRIGHLVRTPERVRDTRVVIDAVSRRDELIGPAVIQQELAAAAEECLEIRPQHSNVAATVAEGAQPRDNA